MRTSVVGRAWRGLLVAVVLAALVLPSAAPAAARTPETVRSTPTARVFLGTPAQRAQDRALLAVVDPRAEVARHAATGRVRFIGGTPTRPAIAAADLGRPATPRAAASAFLFRFGSLIGVAHPAAICRSPASDRLTAAGHSSATNSWTAASPSWAAT